MLKILLVDDSPEVQSRLMELLAVEAGVRVVGCAATAPDALALARHCGPDIVVLDVALRDGDRGYDVLQRLGTACPGCRVIVLSNFGWGAMRAAFLRAGASAYFDKSFEFGRARDWIVAQAAQGRPA